MSEKHRKRLHKHFAKDKLPKEFGDSIRTALYRSSKVQEELKELRGTYGEMPYTLSLEPRTLIKGLALDNPEMMLKTIQKASHKETNHKEARSLINAMVEAVLQSTKLKKDAKTLIDRVNLDPNYKPNYSIELAELVMLAWQEKHLTTKPKSAKELSSLDHLRFN